MNLWEVVDLTPVEVSGIFHSGALQSQLGYINITTYFVLLDHLFPGNVKLYSYIKSYPMAHCIQSVVGWIK